MRGVRAAVIRSTAAGRSYSSWIVKAPPWVREVTTPVDMYTVVLVGSSDSRTVAGRFVTPRGCTWRSAAKTVP